MRPEPLTHDELMRVFKLIAKGLNWRESRRLTIKLKALNEWAKEGDCDTFCVRNVRGYLFMAGEHVQPETLDVC